MNDHDDNDAHIQGLLDTGRALKAARTEVSALKGELAETRTRHGVEIAEQSETHQKEKRRLEASFEMERAARNAAEKREHEANIKAEYWLARVSGMQARVEAVIEACTLMKSQAQDGLYKPRASFPIDTVDLEDGIRQLAIVQQGPRYHDER